MPTSRAWFYRKNQATYDLELGHQSIPGPDELEDRDILVAIEAVSLNYRDLVAWKNMAGRAVDGRIPASDGAGTVIAVGASVKQWRISILWPPRLFHARHLLLGTHWSPAAA